MLCNTRLLNSLRQRDCGLVVNFGLLRALSGYLGLTNYPYLEYPSSDPYLEYPSNLRIPQVYAGWDYCSPIRL